MDFLTDLSAVALVVGIVIFVSSFIKKEFNWIDPSKVDTILLLLGVYIIIGSNILFLASRILRAFIS
jgi:hypothetical protein